MLRAFLCEHHQGYCPARHAQKRFGQSCIEWQKPLGLCLSPETNCASSPSLCCLIAILPLLPMEIYNHGPFEDTYRDLALSKARQLQYQDSGSSFDQ